MKISLHQQVETMNVLSSQAAHDMVARGEKARWQDLVWCPLRVFFRSYVRAGYYRRGMRGFISAVIEGYGEVARYAKLWELQQGKETHGQVMGDPTGVADSSRLCRGR